MNDDKKNFDLLTRFIDGDESALREIIDEYKDPLYSFLWRFLNRQDLVEDVFQETFLQLYTSRESFDPKRSLRPWLFTIAANKAKDVLRKIKRTSALSVGAMSSEDEMSIDDVFNSFSSYETTPVDELLTEERGELVRKIIAEMPENLRGILILAYFKQFSYKQMAEILSIPIGTVKSRLHSAVAYFSKKWTVLNLGSNSQ